MDTTSVQLKLLKLLLSKDFLEANSAHILPELFPGELGLLYSTILESQEKYGRDITVDELRDILLTSNSSRSRAQRTLLHELCTDIDEITPMGADVAADVLATVWQEQIGHMIAEAGLLMVDGKPNLPNLRVLLDKSENGFMPDLEVLEVCDDVDTVLTTIGDRSQWQINVPTLAEALPGISEEEFLVITARPETGKTALWVSLAASPGGFCDQGADVHVVCNEEPPIRTMLRAICSKTGMDAAQVRENPKKAKELFQEIRGKLHLLDTPQMSIEQLDAYCKKAKPSVLVIDQIDKLTINGSFSREDERLTALYGAVRAMAKIRKCAIVAMTQTSAEGDGKTQLSLAWMAGSKTGKAAEADVVMGVGATEDLESPLRYITFAKNKITGNHSTVVVKLDAQISRYVA